VPPCWTVYDLDPDPVDAVEKPAASVAVARARLTRRCDATADDLTAPDRRSKASPAVDRFLCRALPGHKSEANPEQSAATPRLVPTVRDFPLSCPVLDISLVEGATGTENGKDVVLVAWAPSNKFVDDDVLGRDHSPDRPVESHLLIVDLDQQEVGPDSIASDQDQVGRITGIGDLLNLKSDVSERVPESVDWFD
jgi:hypothetical protein